MKIQIKLVTFSLQLLFFIFSATAYADINNDEVDKINSFTINVYQQKSDLKQNLVISPYSLFAVLEKLALGTAGNTKIQMQQLLFNNTQLNFNKYNTDIDKLNAQLIQDNKCQIWLYCKAKYLLSSLDIVSPPPDFIFANAIWIDKTINYKKIFVANNNETPDFFHPIDFLYKPKQALNTINDWVETNTNNKIKGFFTSELISSFTKLILTNVVYFKGDWLHKFKSINTIQDDFNLVDGSKIKVPMMNQNEDFLYTENSQLQMIQLPYKNSTLSMAIILPKDNQTLQNIQGKLTPELFRSLLNMSSSANVSLSMPRFKIYSEFLSFRTILEKMGLKDIFIVGKADFSNLTNSALVLSDAMQKTLIEVDEEGTVAIAVTSSTLFVGSPPKQFNANHPFLFIVFDKKTQVILFIGHVVRPD